MRQLILLTFLICISLLETACGPDSSKEAEQPRALTWEGAGPVIDDGEILSAAERALLATDLETYAQSSGVRLMLYTVPSVEGANIEGLSLELKDRLQAGEPGLNNGGIIYMSKEDRQVKVEAEPGLEWQVPDSIAFQIVDLMLPDFREGRFYAGLKTGFGRLADLGAAVSWTPAFEGWAAVQAADSAALGKIVRLSGSGPHRDVGTGYTRQQFDPQLYGMLGLAPDDSVEVRFSRYMLDMFDNHFGTERSVTLLGRVQQLDPPVVQLLGVE